MKALLWALLLGLWYLPVVLAGSACEEQSLSPEAVAGASRLGVALYQTLEAQGASLAVVGRVGSDLSEQGLVFSHAGLAVREAGHWTVVHLLNHCGSDRSALYDEGLVNFFLDHPHAYQAAVAFVSPETVAALHAALAGGQLAGQLHEPRYNTIAHPRSQAFQNSNQWLLEFTVAAVEGIPGDRQAVQAHLGAFQPDIVRVSLGKRVGAGLFRANVDFMDHPFADRVRGEYQVVTVRALIRWLLQTGRLTQLQVLELGRPSLRFEGAGLAAGVEGL